jgi:hypothetical protein
MSWPDVEAIAVKIAQTITNRNKCFHAEYKIDFLHTDNKYAITHNPVATAMKIELYGRTNTIKAMPPVDPDIKYRIDFLFTSLCRNLSHV